MSDSTQRREEAAQALGIARLPVEEQENTIAMIGETLFRRVFLALHDTLGEKESDRFVTMIKEGKPFDELDAFLSEKASEYPNTLQSVLDELGSEFEKARSLANTEYQTYANIQS